MIHSLRILIVDDQERARKSVRALLSTWPRRLAIHEAGDGRQALRLVGELQPDVVLMDMRMPAMDGLQATQHIKAGWPRVKVIILSMYAESRHEALAAGADAFVAKSDAPEQLLGVLATITEVR